MPPPKLLEIVLCWLLPPAAREHVLGDLSERYRSPKSYVIDALSVIGPVIITRIRRATDFQVFLMEAVALYLSFAAAAWYLGQESFLYQHAGFARLALPVAVAVIALLFCNAYSDLEKKSFYRPIVQSIGSVALAFSGQTMIFDTNRGFAIPFQTMLVGSMLGAFLVSALLMLFPPSTKWKLASTGSRVPRGNNHQRRQGLRFYFHGGVILAVVLLFAPIWLPALPSPRLLLMTLVFLVVVRIAGGAL